MAKKACATNVATEAYLSPHLLKILGDKESSLSFLNYVYNICLKVDITLILKLTFYCPYMAHNFYNYQEYEIKEIELVDTFILPVATCGEWRQGWTPLVYKNLHLILRYISP
jgi:hypothetical protein